ncbi:hypothetical protein AMTRI_Chr05g70550 [Amborella trichopoda]
MSSYLLFPPCPLFFFNVLFPQKATQNGIDMAPFSAIPPLFLTSLFHGLLQISHRALQFIKLLQSLLSYLLLSDMKLSEISAKFNINPIELVGSNNLDQQTSQNLILSAKTTIKIPIQCPCINGVRQSVSTLSLFNQWRLFVLVLETWLVLTR